MKKKLYILIPVLVLVMALGAIDHAEAGLFGKNKEKNKESAKTWRFQRMPTMNFTTGTLSRDILTQWELDGTRVILKDDCRIVGKNGLNGRLQEGENVIIMGPRVGDTIVAWQIRVLASNHMKPGNGRDLNITWSEVDPTVGEGTGPE